MPVEQKSTTVALADDLFAQSFGGDSIRQLDELPRYERRL